MKGSDLISKVCKAIDMVGAAVIETPAGDVIVYSCDPYDLAGAFSFEVSTDTIERDVVTVCNNFSYGWALSVKGLI